MQLPYMTASMKLLLLQLLLLLLAVVVVVVGEADEDQCEPWSCGDLHNISYPFRLKGDPRINCGHPDYELACENNRAILYLYHGSYYVLSISYHNLIIRVVDTGLQPHNCSSLTRHSLTRYNFSNEQDPYQLNVIPVFVFLNCGIDVVIDSSQYVDMSPCINTSSSVPKNPRNSSSNYYVVWTSSPNDIKDRCTVELIAPSTTEMMAFSRSLKIKTYYEIHRELSKGVVLSWSNLLCRHCFHRRRQCLVPRYPSDKWNGLSTPLSCNRNCRAPLQSFACA
ncbi:hypothetical protein Sjap_021104 [Stephania japonica]|uniref:Wall-associated receptor kinase galacturonan-binding domain-containing protein n=1 Tax=Stephania japonica TaxID=461633 RepID=A0AAP0F4N9_9MAGN